MSHLTFVGKCLKANVGLRVFCVKEVLLAQLAVILRLIYLKWPSICCRVILPTNVSLAG